MEITGAKNETAVMVDHDSPEPSPRAGQTETALADEAEEEGGEKEGEVGERPSQRRDLGRDQ